jgi:ABC-2 type transport system ATP-binding protein
VTGGTDDRSGRTHEGVPGRDRGGEGHLLLRRARRGVRAARPQRRGQVDDGRDADDDGHADERNRAARRSRRRGGPIAARSVSSVVFQEPVVDRSLSGRRNLALHANLWRTPGTRIDELAASFSLGSLLDRPVETYSGGQRRRLEIARALVSEPRVLFLDEPTVGLDPRIRHELLDVIDGLRDRTGLTLLLTTHYLDEAERLCDRVAIIHRGEIVALGSPAALRSALGEEIVELRIDGDGDRALARLREHGVAADTAFAVGSTVTLPLVDRGAAATLTEIEVLALPVTAISTRRPSLDDVYLRLTGGRLHPAA